MAKLQLRFLQISGLERPPAAVDFVPGLNVIFGGSNTGKSHILKLIDYMLGAKNPPEPIPEQSGYDLGHLGIVFADGTAKTLVRALQGGEFRILDGLDRKRPTKNEGVTLSAQHSAKSSLSKTLLEKLGATGTRIRTNATGNTRDLSFRDVAHHVLIEEAKIQLPTSPILSGQVITKTAETSVFKFLLSGVDDSALDITKRDGDDILRQAAQLELLDRQIRDLDREITESSHDPEELKRLDESVEKELTQSFQVQEINETSYRALNAQRLRLKREYQDSEDRMLEIETLVARFQLLTEHYLSDEQRLISISEAGQFFVMEESGVCPVCGAAPKDHRPAAACEGDVEDVIAAANAEIVSLRERAAELSVTIKALGSEHEMLAARLIDLASNHENLQSQIMKEVPNVQATRAFTREIIQRKIDVQKNLGVVRQRDLMLRQRSNLGIDENVDSATMVAQQQLDGTLLDVFSQEIEAELQAWKFPNANRVFFELPKLDVSVSGKSRAANGKGVRALLHGAFSIGLMKFCDKKKLSHPGFLVLDSLFITYRDPDDPADQAISATPLRDRAFESFLQMSENLQLIILENVDVPEWLEDKPICTHFTGQPGVGRTGFFPSLSSSK